MDKEKIIEKQQQEINQEKSGICSNLVIGIQNFQQKVWQVVIHMQTT